MRKVVSFLLVCFHLLVLVAAPVDEPTARKAAVRYWNNCLHQPVMEVRQEPVELTGLYVYNMGRAQGYVVMSAESSVLPVLAYSTHGCYEVGVSPAADGMLRSYSNQIEAVVKGTAGRGGGVVPMEWQRLTGGAEPVGVTIVGPLVESHWGRGVYYNVFCPPVSARDDGHTDAGSLAVAMAQLMRYWKFPIQGLGTHTYTDATYGVQTYNYGHITNQFNYNNMPVTLNQLNDESEYSAVGRLIYACAASVNTQFGFMSDGGSRASVQTVVADSVLSAHFRYSKGYKYLERRLYSDSAWCAILRNDLNCGRPVIYTGEGSGEVISFLCDGYDSEGRFHFNWGNTGLYDGFYTISALAPSFAGHAFSINHSAIVGVEPSTIDLVVSPNHLNIDGAGGSNMFSVLSATNVVADWTAICDADWVSVSPATGVSGGVQTTVAVNTTPNTTGSTRRAVIVVLQGSQRATVELVQPDGTPAQAGWVGNNDNQTNANTTAANEQIILRPEAFANLYTGMKVTQVRFTNNIAEGTYTIRIYENPDFDVPLRRDGHTPDVQRCLGTEVFSMEYTQLQYGEQVVTLTNDSRNPTPYNIRSGVRFWVTIQPHQECTFRTRNVPHPPFDGFSVSIPLVDSLRAGYLYTKDGQLYVPYTSEWPDIQSMLVQQSDIEYCFDIQVEGASHDCTPTTVIEHKSVCDYYDWHSRRLTQSSGDHTPYIDTVATAIEGCDSIYCLYLTVNHASDTTYIDPQVCDSYFWIDSNYTQSTTTVRTFKNKFTCDSAVMLRLRLLKNTGEWSEHACDSFFWVDQTFRTAGNYTKTLTNRHGCDSVTTLHLTMGYGSHYTDELEGCDSVVWHGRTFMATGRYEYDYINAQQCRSVDTLKLTLHHSVHRDTSAVGYDMFYWNGFTYRSNGDYSYYGRTSHQCDSIVTLHLQLQHPCHPSHTYLSATVCDSFLWHGNVLRSSGSGYTHVMAGSNGCDSTLHLTLIVNHSVRQVSDQVVCDSVWVGNHCYRMSGVYTDTLQAANSCDSVSTLQLTVIRSSVADTAAVAVDHFVWRGITYREEGSHVYADTTTNYVGCDSITRLHLTITSGATIRDSVIFDVVCDSLVWRGDVYREIGSHSYSKVVGTNQAGYDSIVMIHFTLAMSEYSLLDTFACDSFYWLAENNTYRRSGQYQFKTVTRDGCEHIEQLRLVIHQSVTDTFAAILERSYYIWDNRAYTEPGFYSRRYETREGCDSVMTLQLLKSEGIEDAVEQTIKVYGGNQVVVVEGGASRQLTLCDVQGRVLMRQQLTGGRHEIKVRHAGVYMVSVGRTVKKVIVR
ncbi:MAG: C10 family peptidase [Bacteroidales bacterium]|nr:C10 family peptidase [Candidatus Colimorpha onthohippi]